MSSPAAISPREPATRDRHAQARPFFQLRRQHAPGLFGFQHERAGSRAATLRDGYAPVVFPDMLAARLGRPRKAFDDWLPVAIPDALAAAFGGGASVDAGRALLRGRLASLCEWLDARLEDPLQAREEAASRLVIACGCVAWRVNFAARRVYPARVHADGTVQEQSIETELHRPLRTAFWLHWAIQDLGLSAAQGQRSLFASKAQAREHDDWLARTAQRLLVADPRFTWLREEGIPRALSLDAELVAIAAHARYVTWPGRVPGSTFNLVWRHETHFRRVARENPRLLKLFEVFLWARALPLKGDPVAEMRDWLRRKGFSDAAWRYVHRHGSRLFDVAWRMANNRSQLAVCVNYLRVLVAAGLPPPPAPSLARAWFRCHVNQYDDRVEFTERWCTADPSVIRAILREGDARRRRPDFARFRDEAAGILHWALETSLELNAQQERSGWKWLARNWKAWRERRRREAEASGERWCSALGRTTIGRFEIVPLTCSRALVDEAIEMRHCVDLYDIRCWADEARIFSVRAPGTGRRVATLSIHERDGNWVPGQVKRFANRSASPELERLAATVAKDYTAAERAEKDAIEAEWQAALNDLEAWARAHGLA